MSKRILNDPKIVGSLLGFITLVLFWPALHGGFIELDDDNYVSGNPFVQQGITRQSLAWATTEVYESYWLPVTWLSFIADRTVQGPEPTGFHLTNLLLHAMNVVLLFLIGHRLTRNLWGSALLAALFGWHPLRVEAVAWISARKDVLSTFFGLLAIVAYERYVRAQRLVNRPLVVQASAPPTGEDRLKPAQQTVGSWPRCVIARFWRCSLNERALANYLMVLLALILSLMAKPMWVTLPFVLLLLDGWPLQRFGGLGSRMKDGAAAPPYRERFSHLLMEKIPMLLVVTIFVFITLSTHRSSGAMPQADLATVLDRLLQIPANYGRYVWKMIWPLHLAIRYPMVETPFLYSVALGSLGIVGTAYGFWCSRRRPWVLIGWLWFLGTFVPIIGVVRVGTADFADRFTYVPSIGISLLVAGTIVAGFSDRFTRTRVIAAVVLLAGCGFATRHQLRFWADGETLFRRALQVTRENAMAHNSLGRTLERQERWPEAMAEYQASLKVAPEFGQAHANLGNVLGLLHRYDEAALHFQAALKSTPNDARIHSNYGSILYEAGRKEEGVLQLREAIRLNDRLADAHFNLGRALLEMGNAAGALEQFVSAARINPHDDAALFQAGRLYLAGGNRALARTFFEAAVRLRPDELDYSQALQGWGPLENKR